MTVDCPNCGQRLEIPGRAATCPNCGQLVTIAAGSAEPLPDPIRDARRAPKYVPPARSEPTMAPWLRSTLIIAGVVICAFIVVNVALLAVRSSMRGRTVATPTPTTPAPAPPQPAPPVTQKGSELFAFDETRDRPDAPTAPAAPVVAESRDVSATPQAATTRATTRRYTPTPAVVASADIVTDERIDSAIRKGVEYLISRFQDGQLKDNQGGTHSGADALCVLAMLHAGEAISDERLNPNNPFMARCLDELRGMTIADDVKTYCTSLRVQALAFANRKADRGVLAADTRWLITNSVRGAHTYRDIPQGATQPSEISWDNSNTQYGTLGAWAAAEAGIAVPMSYWADVQRHWEESQNKNGSWSYKIGGDDGTLAMTAAGVNMLFVANEMLAASRPNVEIARPPFSPSLQAGLDWMAKGDNAVNLGGTAFPYYTLYGMERAGLACGFKMFGRHDWFRALAGNALKSQSAESGNWGNEIDTAFTILFLARGRHPLMMNKLHYVGAWANRPRDVARLAKFTSRELERALNWQVVSLGADWPDWLDSPILYLASHEAPIFDDSDYEKLRQFCLAGGLLFTNADGDSKEFNQWAKLLAMRLFPEQPMADLPENHFIYTTPYKPKDRIRLRGVSNATRMMLIHSPTDIARRWQARDPKVDRDAFELGANMFIYATGLQVPRNRVATLAVANVPGEAKDVIEIARLKHAGDWNPEPYAWDRAARVFRRDTSIGLKAIATEIEKLDVEKTPLAHLTSTAAFSLTDAQIAALSKFVDAGGVLLIDPCGGAAPVAESIRSNILARAFAGKEPAPLRTDHPLIAGRGAGLTQIAKALVRPYVLSVRGQNFTRPMIIESGKGAVLVTDLDLTSGLLGTNTLGILGYDPGYAMTFVKNVILWGVNER